MRPAFLLLTLVLLAALASTTSAQAQLPKSHNITLYAHSEGNLLLLSADAPAGPRQAADATSTITFKLTPALGENLRIYGAITVTTYLRTDTLLLGTLSVQVTELKSTGEQVPVPGATIDTPVSLDSRTLPFNLGVGIIDYEFGRGSAIQLQVRVSVSGRPTAPYLVWNDPKTPTSLTIPAIEPTQAKITISSDSLHFGRILSTTTSNGPANLTFTANVTDALGIYRLGDSSLVLTTPNGTSRQFQPTVTPISTYSGTYTQTATLSEGSWQISLHIADGSGNTYIFNDSAWVTRFYDVRFNVVDSSENALQNASVIVTFQKDGRWTGMTNATGWTILSLPSSEDLGPLNFTVSWHNIEAQPITPLNVAPSTVRKITVLIFDITIRLVTSGIPVPNAEVWLVQGVAIAAHANTGLNGTVTFKRIPAGNYTLLTHYLYSQNQTRLSVNANGFKEINLPTPYRNEILIFFIILVAGSTFIFIARRRTRLYPQDFGHFNRLTMGGLPKSCFALVAGNSGSGKSVLLESLAAEHLVQGQGCVYIINTEYPSKIRENMVTLGMSIDEAVENGKLLFIDSYSAIGGAVSKENYSVSSHTDLTGLGMKISRCLEELGPATDVYLDSIMPLLTALRVDYLLNFLQSIAAKVKANDGRLCLTVGTAIEKTDMVKLEEAADCVIETQLQESGKGQRRKLRVKKLRGKPYTDKWVSFQIESGKGIVFLTRTKSEATAIP